MGSSQSGCEAGDDLGLEEAFYLSILDELGNSSIPSPGQLIGVRKLGSATGANELVGYRVHYCERTFCLWAFRR